MAIQKKLQEVLYHIKEGRHPSDLAELVEDLPDEHKAELFDYLSDEEAVQIAQGMEEHRQRALFTLLTPRRASSILKKMSTDDVADILSEIPLPLREEILEALGEEAEEIRSLLKYPEDSAGGIMTTEFISLTADTPVEEAIRRLREIAPRAETIYYVYVVDEAARLTGVLSLRELIAASDGTQIKEIMNTNIIAVEAETDQEEVARLVARYDLLAIPVVSGDGRLMGIITVDDILDVIEEEATEDIYRLGGTSEVEGVDITQASVRQVVARRLPWLFISLVGGLLSGSVIGGFEATLEKIIVLAVFIPVIMDMGGNVGTQSSTIFVRGVATGAIGAEQTWSYFFKEIKTGLAIGFFSGLLIALVTFLWKGIPVLGLVVGVSMFGTVILAALIGTLVPMLCNKVGIDPAVTAGPFVTTIKDVTGLMIYFTIATLFLEHLT